MKKSQFFSIITDTKNIRLNRTYLTNLLIGNFMSLQISAWSVVNCLVNKLLPNMNLSQSLITPFFLSSQTTLGKT